MFKKINVTFVEKDEFKVNELIYPALVSIRSKGVRWLKIELWAK